MIDYAFFYIRMRSVLCGMGRLCILGIFLSVGTVPPANALAPKTQLERITPEAALRLVVASILDHAREANVPVQSALSPERRIAIDRLLASQGSDIVVEYDSLQVEFRPSDVAMHLSLRIKVGGRPFQALATVRGILQGPAYLAPIPADAATFLSMQKKTQTEIRLMPIATEDLRRLAQGIRDAKKVHALSNIVLKHILQRGRRDDDLAKELRAFYEAAREVTPITLRYDGIAQEGEVFYVPFSFEGMSSPFQYALRVEADSVQIVDDSERLKDIERKQSDVTDRIIQRYEDAIAMIPVEGEEVSRSGMLNRRLYDQYLIARVLASVVKEMGLWHQPVLDAQRESLFSPANLIDNMIARETIATPDFFAGVWEELLEYSLLGEAETWRVYDTTDLDLLLDQLRPPAEPHLYALHLEASDRVMQNFHEENEMARYREAVDKVNAVIQRDHVQITDEVLYRMVKDIHATLMDPTDAEDPRIDSETGYRRVAAQSLGWNFPNERYIHEKYGPDADMDIRANIEDLMSRFYDWLAREMNKIRRGEVDSYHPVELAAKAFYRFVKVHPFADGNERTARLLMGYVLIKNGYPPFTLNPENNVIYYTVLRFRQDAQQFLSEGVVRGGLGYTGPQGVPRDAVPINEELSVSDEFVQFVVDEVGKSVDRLATFEPEGTAEQPIAEEKRPLVEKIARFQLVYSLFTSEQGKVLLAELLPKPLRDLARIHGHQIGYRFRDKKGEVYIHDPERGELVLWRLQDYYDPSLAKGLRYDVVAPWHLNRFFPEENLPFHYLSGTIYRELVENVALLASWMGKADNDSYVFVQTVPSNYRHFRLLVREGYDVPLEEQGKLDELMLIANASHEDLPRTGDRQEHYRWALRRVERVTVDVLEQAGSFPLLRLATRGLSGADASKYRMPMDRYFLERALLRLLKHGNRAQRRLALERLAAMDVSGQRDIIMSLNREDRGRVLVSLLRMGNFPIGRFAAEGSDKAFQVSEPLRRLDHGSTTVVYQTGGIVVKIPLKFEHIPDRSDDALPPQRRIDFVEDIMPGYLLAKKKAGGYGVGTTLVRDLRIPLEHFPDARKLLLGQQATIEGAFVVVPWAILQDAHPEYLLDRLLALESARSTEQTTQEMDTLMRNYLNVQIGLISVGIFDRDKLVANHVLEPDGSVRKFDYNNFSSESEHATAGRIRDYFRVELPAMWKGVERVHPILFEAFHRALDTLLAETDFNSVWLSRASEAEPLADVEGLSQILVPVSALDRSVSGRPAFEQAL